MGTYGDVGYGLVAQRIGSVAKMDGTVMVEVAGTKRSCILRIREPGERTRREKSCLEQ